MLIYTIVLLGLVGLVAGFVDAIAGGGGLLTLPALKLAGLSDIAALATNKGQSVFGSGMALARFYHSPLLDRKRAIVSFPAALVGAVTGAMLVSLIRKEVLQPIVIGLLFAVALFMIFYRPPTHHVAKPRGAIVAGVIAFVIAAYDGFFGPGTGTFLIIAYVLFFADALDRASANAKVANFASNLGALCFFITSGHIRWEAAIPMAIGQALGGFLGAHFTIKRGAKTVRIAVVAVSCILIGVLAWRTLFQ